MGPPFAITCRLRCSEKISNSQRQHLFQNYWGLSSKEKHWQYISHHTKSIDKKVNKVCPKIVRSCSRKYYFTVENADGSNGEINIQWTT